MVLGQIHPRKIVPNPKTKPNPHPNPNPNREAILLGDNYPDTKINIIQINQNNIKVTCFRTRLEQIFTVHFWQKHKSRDNKRKEGVILSFSFFTTLLLKLIYQPGNYFKDLTRFIFKTLPNICDGEKPLCHMSLTSICIRQYQWYSNLRHKTLK